MSCEAFKIMIIIILKSKRDEAGIGFPDSTNEVKGQLHKYSAYIYCCNISRQVEKNLTITESGC